MSRPYRVVLCEGYHDRAFWQGALEALRCTDPGLAPGGVRKQVQDSYGRPVTGGHYVFDTPSGACVRIVPCRGKTEIVPALKRELTGRGTRPFEYVVVNWDDDGDARKGIVPPVLPGAVVTEVRRADPSAAVTNGTIAIDGGTAHVGIAIWFAADAHSQLLPWQQTLERVVAAALTTAYPARGSAVSAWLTGAPGGPKNGHKEHAWSHMAGWYSDDGCEAFYRLLWHDDAVKAELIRRLSVTPAWAQFMAIAR